MKLRISTLNTPLFDHEGLLLDEKWQTVDVDKLPPAGREAIRKYRGHILQVHPEDVATFDELAAQLDADAAKPTKPAKK